MIENEIFIDVDERLAPLTGTPFNLVRKIDGTAHAIDTLILAHFVIFPKGEVQAIDLGSGNGILSFLLKHRKPDLCIKGIEVQKNLHELSLRNLSINKGVEGMTFELLDIKEVPSRFLPGSFDLVVANPPYYPLGSGALPHRASKSFARHEVSITLKDFIEASSYLLSYGSPLNLVIPTNRFYECLDYFKPVNFGISRLRFVKPKDPEPSHIVLIEAIRFFNGKHQPVPDLIIRKEDGKFSDEIENYFL